MWIVIPILWRMKLKKLYATVGFANSGIWKSLRRYTLRSSKVFYIIILLCIEEETEDQRKNFHRAPSELWFTPKSIWHQSPSSSLLHDISFQRNTPLLAMHLRINFEKLRRCRVTRRRPQVILGLWWLSDFFQNPSKSLEIWMISYLWLVKEIT